MTNIAADADDPGSRMSQLTADFHEREAEQVQPQPGLRCGRPLMASVPRDGIVNTDYSPRSRNVRGTQDGQHDPGMPGVPD